MKILAASCIFLTSALYCHAQLDSLRQVIDKKPENNETIVWICDTAFPFWTSDPDITEALGKIALKKAKNADFIEGLAKANHVIGTSYWARDLYTLAIEHYLEALKYYEQLSDQRGIANISLNIGTLYDDLQQFDRAKLYERKGLAMHRLRNDTLGITRSLNNLGVLYKRMGLKDSAFIFYEESMQLRRILKDTIGIARIYNNLAVIQVEENGDRQALDNLGLARDLLRLKEDENLLTSVFSNYGRALTNTRRFTSAEAYLDSALALSVKINSLDKERTVYQFLKELALAQNQKELAFDHMVQEAELDKMIRSEKVAKQIEQISAQYEKEKSDRKLIELESEKNQQVALRRYAYGVAILILLISVFLIYTIIGRNKRAKLEVALSLQKLKEELTLKNKEISSYTLNFIQRNQVMEDLKAQLIDLKSQSGSDTSHQLNKINRMVDSTFRADEEWETFRLTFEQMHDGFFSTLKESHPDLGNAELKLCALLRLNMNLKESASILGISADSVKTARYRLRKKLGLKTEDNLVDFLIRFEQEKLVEN